MRKQLNTLNTKENFINVLVDCDGYSEEDAIDFAEEYHNDLEKWIIDRGGDERAIEECRKFCGI